MSGPRELRVGFDGDTLIRVTPAESRVSTLEVIALRQASSPPGFRARVGIAWAALRARYSGAGFVLTSAAQTRALAGAIGAETVGQVIKPDPWPDGADRYVTLGRCSDGCVVHVRAWAPDEDQAGWISVGFMSPPSVRRDCSLRGRLRNALSALSGRYGWTAWDPITEPTGLVDLLEGACELAFPDPGPREEI